MKTAATARRVNAESRKEGGVCKRSGWGQACCWCAELVKGHCQGLVEGVHVAAVEGGDTSCEVDAARQSASARAPYTKSES
jgi:hypothetical protein